jgi:hypothetical protein
LAARKGAPVTFTQTTPGVYDGTTGQWSDDVTVTVEGYAMQISGNPDLYTQLGLIESANPTLSFTPKTLGVVPALGMTVVWGGDTLTVKNINPLAKAGIATKAHIVVSR